LINCGSRTAYTMASFKSLERNADKASVISTILLRGRT
jgi:hypothetical protein